MRLAEEGCGGAGSLMSVSQTFASGNSLKGPDLDFLAWGLLGGAWGATVFIASAGHPRLCYSELEPGTSCGCTSATAKAGRTAGWFGATVNSRDVLHTVSSDGILPGAKCKLLSFDQGTCSIFHLASQVLLHESFLAVLNLHFQGSSQATPCQYQLTCPSRLGFTHLLTFQINTFLLLPRCYFLKYIYILL